MFRALLRLLVIALILIAVGAFFFGYRWRAHRDVATNQPVVTSSPNEPIDRDRARQAGAEIADKVAKTANKAEQALSQASLTAKIKSKMALDDTLASSGINVDTEGSQVTLRGSVPTEVQHQRALQLARETDGVTAVVDRLGVTSR